ncbi:MAG: yvdT 2 [Acidimicrobiales bacterium]|nr:yvdT 2 [Acidimicrobiales bacterium]
MRERILNGALEALAIYGSRRFSVSAVSELAGISRGTLYRYFPTKEDLLDGLTAHMGRDFRRSLHQHVAEELTGEERVDHVVAAMREYVDKTPIFTQLLVAEPTFVRTFYNEQFHDLVRLVATNLKPSAKGGKAAPSASALLAAELLVRVAISYRIVGADDGPLANGDFVKRLSSLLASELFDDEVAAKPPAAHA